jgi:hypothetical protein
MALYDTIKTYNGDGVTSDFAITFPYDDSDELVVSRKNGAVTWFLLNPSLLRITSPAALAVGDVLTIQRSTNIDSPAVVFKNGAGVTASSLNSIFTQFFRSLNEVRDVAFRSLTLLATGVFDAVNARITNVGAPTAASDAARLQDVLDAQIAAGNVPTPTGGDAAKVLTATGANAYSWQASGGVADGSITPAKLSTGKPSWDAAGNITRTGDDFGPAPTSIAAAATTSIFAEKADCVTVTGNTGITSFGTGTNGKFKLVTFTGTPTLTHSASLDLQGNANFTMAAGDVALVQSLGGTNSKVIAIWRDAGLSKAQMTGAGGLAVFSNGNTGLVPDPVSASGRVLKDNASWGGTITATAVAASGVAVDFNSIPAGVRRIQVCVAGLSTNGTTQVRMQIGSGSISATGYTGSTDGATSAGQAAQTFTSGLALCRTTTTSAAASIHGIATLTHLGGNQWALNWLGARSDAAVLMYGAASITLGGVLDRVRVTADGTDTFDAGNITLLYEF